MTELAELVARAAQLAGAGRRLLGITGPPGAGKSRLADRIVQELAGRAVLVGMDGFHLADAELVRIGLRDRKGAPETFDRDGFVALLSRLRANAGTVYAPVFDRAWEDSRAAAVAVPTAVPLVVVEGNYLLYWPEVGPLLDEVWYLDPDPVRRPGWPVRTNAMPSWWPPVATVPTGGSAGVRSWLISKPIDAPPRANSRKR